MNTMIIGFPDLPEPKPQAQADEAQDLRKKLAEVRGKLGYQTKVNNRLKKELEAHGTGSKHSG